MDKTYTVGPTLPSPESAWVQLDFPPDEIHEKKVKERAPSLITKLVHQWRTVQPLRLAVFLGLVGFLVLATVSENGRGSWWSYRCVQGLANPTTGVPQPVVAISYGHRTL